MKFKNLFAAVVVLGACLGSAQAQTKAGVVYCNNETGVSADCAMYYYSRPEGTVIRGTKDQAVVAQNNINIATKGTTVVNINNNYNGSARPRTILVEQYIGRGASLKTSKLNWTPVGGGFRCETPVVTCQLKEEAVLDTGCSCGTARGRVRGVVVP